MCFDALFRNAPRTESTGRAEQIDLNGLLDEFANLAYHGMRAQDSAFNITI
jgi:hypothetical protein